MPSSFILTLCLGFALSAAASAQSTFSGKKPATVPVVTVTKPGTASTAADSDVRNSVRVASAVVNDVKQPANGNGGNAVFRPGDSLDMRISGIPPDAAVAFPTPITIGSDGFVNITYVGQIRAAGLTQSELENAIKKSLIDKKIFRFPTININVMNQVRYVTVGGAVRAPNRYIWTSDLTLMTAIASAGGPGDFGGDKINLIRGGTVTLYRYKALKKNPADDPKLLPGDQIDVL
jgi:protein involved in polysaccharide export with SLBB domain